MASPDTAALAKLSGELEDLECGRPTTTTTTPQTSPRDFRVLELEIQKAASQQAASGRITTTSRLSNLRRNKCFAASASVCAITAMCGGFYCIFAFLA